MFSRSVSAVFVFLAACGSVPLDAPQGDHVDSARVVMAEGSAEAIGVLNFVNFSGTTLEMLDDEVGLDKRAAKAIVHHRDGADGIANTRDDDLFDSIAELDARYYVGSSALQKLLDHADASGWVARGDQILGTWDGVMFTADEAEAVLSLANNVPYDVLDIDVGLNARAVDSIVEARPIGSVEELAGLYYVGGSALKSMMDYAVPSNGQWTTDEALAHLEEHTADLWHISETDAPVRPIVLDARPTDDGTMQIRDAGDFYDQYDYDDAWLEMLSVFQHLEDTKVYRFGEIEIEVIVVGESADGELVGFTTFAVET